MKIAYSVAVVISAIVLAGFGAPSGDFPSRVRQYVKLHQRLAKQLPKLKSTGASATIENHQQALAMKIRAARASARPGDIFTPEASREFRQLLRSGLAPADAERVRASLQNADPTVHVTLKVNESYPPDAPLQSMPPTLLMSLPRLPPELDYRIAGRALVLRDTIANVIVDLIPDWLPEPK